MKQEPLTSGQTHLVRLDVLRAIAVLSVFVYHLLGIAFGAYTFPWNHAWLDFSQAPSRSFYAFYPATFLWTGVPLFFVISGFCIHYSFLNAKDYSTRAFYARRFWRIYPSYIFCLLILAGMQKRNGAPPDVPQFFSHLFLVHNLSQKTIFGINTPFWSLGTEVQLYLIYPLFLWIRARRGIRGAFLVALTASLVARIPAALLTDWSQDPRASLWESPLILWCDWTLGAFLAEQYFQKKRLFNFGGGALSALMALFWFSTVWKYASTFSFSLASLIWAIVLERYLWRQSSLPTIWERILPPIGLCSYSLYLWHFPLQRHVIDALARFHLPRSPLLIMTLGFWATLSVCLVVSWSLYRFIEIPGIGFGKKVSRRLAPHLP